MSSGCSPGRDGRIVGVRRAGLGAATRLPDLHVAFDYTKPSTLILALVEIVVGLALAVVAVRAQRLPAPISVLRRITPARSTATRPSDDRLRPGRGRAARLLTSRC
ncbi:MAG: hypothetical protein ACR2LX_09245 [Jatrophihabitans sp.]